MKQNKKIKIVIFSSLLGILILPIGVVLASNYIPDAPGDVYETIDGNSIARYIKAIYQYALGSVGIIAAIFMMFGGVRWIAAGGNMEQVGQAKSMITAALTGLVIALASYSILWIVNPALVTFQPIGVTTVGDVGCCTYKDKASGQQKCASVNSLRECVTSWNGSFSQGSVCQYKDGVYSCVSSEAKDNNPYSACCYRHLAKYCHPFNPKYARPTNCHKAGGQYFSQTCDSLDQCKATGVKMGDKVPAE